MWAARSVLKPVLLTSSERAPVSGSFSHKDSGGADVIMLLVVMLIYSQNQKTFRCLPDLHRLAWDGREWVELLVLCLYVTQIEVKVHTDESVVFLKGRNNMLVPSETPDKTWQRVLSVKRFLKVSCVFYIYSTEVQQFWSYDRRCKSQPGFLWWSQYKSRRSECFIQPVSFLFLRLRPLEHPESCRDVRDEFLVQDYTSQIVVWLF